MSARALIEAPALHPDHRADLRRSGLSDETIVAAGIRSLAPAELPRRLSPSLAPKVLSGCIFPYPAAGDFYRVKVFPPVQEGGGHHVRYYQPAGTVPRLYIPPRTQAALADPTLQLLITEGEKKALKADQEGLTCVAIGGLWTWLLEGKPIPDLDLIDCCDRPLLLVPDSDVWLRPDLLNAVYAFAKELEGRGGKPAVVKLPAGSGGAKVGLDDYLCGHSITDFEALPKLGVDHRVFSRAAQWWESWIRRRPAAATPATGADARAAIDASDLDLPRVTERAWAALTAANSPPGLFRVGPTLVRLEADEEHLPALQPLNVDRLRYHLARAAAWRRGSSPDASPALPPEHVARDMLARPDPPLPVVARIVAAPVFATNGRLLREPGYDAEAQLYYAPARGLMIPPVPDAPIAEEIARARSLLYDGLLGDFPFVGDAERAHAIALLLLPFVRDLIGGRTPLHLVEKPFPGTGAGLLVRVVTLPAHGRAPAMMTEGRDEDEWRKRLTAKLVSAPAIIVIDNLRRRLDSAALSSAITADVWEDRLLGQTQMVRARVRCAWVATGNNPALSGEIARRAVRIRLDAKIDRPWLRTEFKHSDLVAWATAHRGDLVWAALTLVRAWLAAGRPEGSAVLGEFEQWARVMGGVLAVAGIEGFLQNLGEFYELADAEGAETRRLLRAWWEKYHDGEVGIRELFELATSDDVGLELPAKTELGQRTQLGRRVAGLRDRRYGLQIDGEELMVHILGAGKEHQAGRWRLVRVGGAGGLGREKVPLSSPGSPAPVEIGEHGNFGELFPGPGPMEEVNL